jgi:uncharacterized membrane protein YdjX (TVP38/TMEM64 family)
MAPCFAGFRRRFPASLSQQHCGSLEQEFPARVKPKFRLRDEDSANLNVELWPGPKYSDRESLNQAPPHSREQRVSGDRSGDSARIVKVIATDQLMDQLRAMIGRRQGLRRYIGPKRVLILAALATVIATAWYLRKQGLLDPTAIGNLIESHPVAAPIMFVIVYGLAMLSALPTLPVNLAAGLFWGPVLGGVYSTTGATLGAIGAFVAARSVLGQPLVRRFENRFVAEIQREFDTQGWLFLAFIRMNPIFPTGPLNYVLGLTSIDTFTYVWATFAFILPPSIAVAWIGHSLGTFVIQGEIEDSLRTVLVASAAVTSLALLAYAAGLFYKLRGGRLPKQTSDRDER